MSFQLFFAIPAPVVKFGRLGDKVRFELRSPENCSASIPERCLVVAMKMRCELAMRTSAFTGLMVSAPMRSGAPAQPKVKLARLDPINRRRDNARLR